MKKFKTLVLLLVLLLILPAISIKARAFDQCAFVGTLLERINFTSSAHAYIYPTGYTYPHAHQSVARLYDVYGTRIAIDYSDYDEGLQRADTSSKPDPAYNNYAFGFPICPLWQ